MSNKMVQLETVDALAEQTLAHCDVPHASDIRQNVGRLHQLKDDVSSSHRQLCEKLQALAGVQVCFAYFWCGYQGKVTALF